MEAETKIIQVLSDLKLNGVLVKAGDFFESEISAFADLIDQGVLRVIHGAQTVDEAVQKVKEEADAAIVSAEEQEAAAEQNTWGAKKDPVEPAPDATTTDTANADANAGGAADTTTEMKPTTPAPDAPVLLKYKVAVAFTVADTESPITGEHQVDDEVEATAEDAAAYVADGSLVADVSDTGDNL